MFLLNGQIQVPLLVKSELHGVPLTPQMQPGNLLICETEFSICHNESTMSIPTSDLVSLPLSYSLFLACVQSESCLASQGTSQLVTSGCDQFGKMKVKKRLPPTV